MSTPLSFVFSSWLYSTLKYGLGLIPFKPNREAMELKTLEEKLEEIKQYGITIGDTPPVSICNEQIRRVGWSILEILEEPEHPRSIMAREAREERKRRRGL